jgi:hypothetical protein
MLQASFNSGWMSCFVIVDWHKMICMPTRKTSSMASDRASLWQSLALGRVTSRSTSQSKHSRLFRASFGRDFNGVHVHTDANAADGED